MLDKITEKYERGKSKKIKLIALCFKAVTGILGASAILTEQHPYICLAILSAGAIADEILGFINEERIPHQP